MPASTKAISMLLVALVATWLPIGQCCLALACDMAAVQHDQPPPDAGCDACHDVDSSTTRPSPPPTPAEHDGCGCVSRLAVTPDADEVTAPSCGGWYLLPALNLSTALPYDVDLPADRRHSLTDADVGPPHAHRSLLAQACLLIV